MLGRLGYPRTRVFVLRGPAGAEKLCAFFLSFCVDSLELKSCVWTVVKVKYQVSFVFNIRLKYGI